MSNSNVLTHGSATVQPFTVDNLPTESSHYKDWGYLVVPEGEDQFTVVLSPDFHPEIFFTYGLFDTEAEAVVGALTFIKSGPFIKLPKKYLYRGRFYRLSSTVFYRVSHHCGFNFYESISNEGYTIKSRPIRKPKKGRPLLVYTAFKEFLAFNI